MVVKFMKLLYLSELQFTKSRNHNTGRLDSKELLRQIVSIQKQWQLTVFKADSKTKKPE